MIHLENIQVTFNKNTPLENPVLRGLSLHIRNGEFVTVIGGNGAGKSTLMNILAGETRIDRGRICIGGENITDYATHERARWVSRVFQDPLKGSCPNLSIEENMAVAAQRGQRRGLGLALNTRWSKHFREQVAELRIGLEDRMTDPMGALSGGQRQAISLLMATLQPAKILLLDEHTAALDPKMAHVVIELTKILVQRHHLTTLMITHSMHQALHCGTRTVLLARGQIAQDLDENARKELTPTDLLAFFENGESVV